jgi:hypothetical protein
MCKKIMSKFEVKKFAKRPPVSTKGSFFIWHLKRVFPVAGNFFSFFLILGGQMKKQAQKSSKTSNKNLSGLCGLSQQCQSWDR